MTKLTEKTKRNSFQQMLVPVRATLLVPVDISDMPVDCECEYTDDGDAVANIADNAEAIAAVSARIADCPEIHDALGMLVAAMLNHTKKHPGTQAFYTPWAGGIEEQEV